MHLTPRVCQSTYFFVHCWTSEHTGKTCVLIWAHKVCKILEEREEEEEKV